MAEINFPNPIQALAQNPPNTFSPTSLPFSTKNGVTYKYNGVGWVIVRDSGNPDEPTAARVTVSPTAPQGNNEQGDLWWNSGAPASLFIWYVDQDPDGSNSSSQWVPASPTTDAWYINSGALTTSVANIDVNVGGTITAGN